MIICVGRWKSNILFIGFVLRCSTMRAWDLCKRIGLCLRYLSSKTIVAIAIEFLLACRLIHLHRHGAANFKCATMIFSARSECHCRVTRRQLRANVFLTDIAANTRLPFSYSSRAVGGAHEKQKNVSPACESMTSIPTCIRFHSRSNPCRMRVACVCVFKWRKSITVIIWLYEIGKFIVCLLIHAFCACTALRFGYDECVIILCGRLDVWHV